MMPYHTPNQLILPLEPYELKEGYYRFGTPVRSRVILWARHLGDDLVVTAGKSVQAIGEGEVVWARMRVGEPKKRNWGGLVILAHASKSPNPHPPITNFYSVYGHMADLKVKEGDQVAMGQQLGAVAPALTPENGWWKIPHLHFAIYVGNWSGEILPGYKRPFDGRTKMRWWRNPKHFIEEYNKS